MQAISHLIYSFLKISARVALRIYCRLIFIDGSQLFREEGPVLFAANHPNSFLDAVLIAAHTRNKTYILVRGDVFKNKWANWFLRFLGCIPVYRRGDGKAMLGQNTFTFQGCLAIFSKGNNVLIFSEGVCENEWNLRPLGKGTARLAFMTLQPPSPIKDLKIIPTGFSYSHFNGIGKNAFLLAAPPINLYENFDGLDDRKKLSAFNHLLRHRLNEIILQFSGSEDQEKTGRQIMENPPFRQRDFGVKQLKELQESISKSIQKSDRSSNRKSIFNTDNLLVLPFALAGWILHAPLYYPVNHLAKTKTIGTVYYDSVLFGLLFLLYPIYLILVTVLLIWVTKNYWCGLLIIAAPILSYFTVQSGIVKRN